MDVLGHCTGSKNLIDSNLNSFKISLLLRGFFQGQSFALPSNV